MAIVNGCVLDSIAMSFSDVAAVVIENGSIVDLADRRPTGLDRVIDARGKYVLPGLIDAHVHTTLTTLDLQRLQTQSVVEWSVQMVAGVAGMLERGFTTVRDAGGDCAGLVAAIDRGLIRGPRIIRAGRVLSQTGGHGDGRRGPIPAPGCSCSIYSDGFCHIADGADAVRKAARHELREGSDFLKIMASGGVASPVDPLESIQFTAEEIRAAVVEAQHRGTYVSAHAYSTASVELAVQNGVACIEHGNMIDERAAALMADKGVVLVPTLVTYKALAEVGRDLGLPEANLRKNLGVFEQGLGAVRLVRQAGVDVAFGTDLLGETQTQQNREFLLRADLESPADVLRSMWVTNPKLCRLEGRIGVVQPGAHADLLVCTANPLDDLRVLADPLANLPVVIAGGDVVRDMTDN